MNKAGRNYFAILTEGHTPANTGGIVDLSPSFKVAKADLISALFIAPAVGVAGKLVTTFAGTYAVGDLIRLTMTSNGTSAQLWRKSYQLTVQAGATSVTAIAAAFAALVSADVSATSPYASATSALGVLTVTQKGDDKRALVGYEYTDSAAGTVATVQTSTVVSEGQPSDLVDRGVAAEDINLASYDTVRIDFNAEAAIPFIDSVGATRKEVYWYGTTGEGANLATLINS
jgi:hypothetical protein